MAGVGYLHEVMMAKNFSDDGLVSKYDYMPWRLPQHVMLTLLTLELPRLPFHLLTSPNPCHNG